jgi:hypothetical protein
VITNLLMDIRADETNRRPTLYLTVDFEDQDIGGVLGTLSAPRLGPWKNDPPKRSRLHLPTVHRVTVARIPGRLSSVERKVGS